jgi:hypothetical protein
MTDKPTFHPKPGRLDAARFVAQPSRMLPHRGGFDPASLGQRVPNGSKGPKGRPIPLPGKSRGR